MSKQTIRIGGPYRVHKAAPARPRREHATFEDAEAEAGRLIEQQPGQSFVIAQIVGMVTDNG